MTITHIKNLKLEVLSDLAYLRNAFRFSNLGKTLFRFFLAFICFNIFPYFFFIWIGLLLYKISIRYCFLILDIIILDIINIPSINKIYDYVSKFFKFIFIKLWFVSIPNFIKKILTFRFWLSLFVKAFEKSILLLGRAIRGSVKFIRRLISYHIPMFIYSSIDWYHLKKRRYKSMKRICFYYINRRKLKVLYYFLFLKSSIRRIINFYKIIWRHRLVSWIIDIKIKLLPYKYKSILLWKQLIYRIRFSLVGHYYSLKMIHLLKCLIMLFLYSLFEYWYNIFLVLKLYFFRK